MALQINSHPFLFRCAIIIVARDAGALIWTMEIKEKVLLKEYTVFKVGGPAHFFIDAKSVEEIKEAASWAREKSLPFFVIGLGSNVLVSDNGFSGLVVKIGLNGIEFLGDDEMRADAGITMARAVNFSLENGLTGFEWAIGVPGTIGGSVRGNAGCFGVEIKNNVKSVEVLNIENSRITAMQNSECGFDYRGSIFKKRPELIITSAVLKLEHGNVEEARTRLAGFIKKRVKSQDIGAKTAGSVFKNVRWEGEMPEGMKFAGSGPKENAAVGYLLESAGLKGFAVGGAKFSEKHANFILNTGNATADDIVRLIALAKERVFEQFGVRLEEEIQYMGF